MCSQAVGKIFIFYTVLSAKYVQVTEQKTTWIDVRIMLYMKL